MRYRVLDLPAIGVGAFTPLPTTNPVASSQGNVVVSALMGLTPVGTPGPPRVWAPPISADPKTQGSNVSPDAILPDAYTAYNRNMGPARFFGMAMRRHNPLPVPAVNIQRSASPAMIGRKMGGRATTVWPRAFQRYPSLTGGTANR